MQLVPGTFMQSGVDLAYLSCFPEERERLYPPLTFLEPKGPPRTLKVKLADGRSITYTIVKAMPHFGS